MSPNALKVVDTDAGGGADRPGNMQWQTKEAAKEKDKTE